MKEFDILKISITKISKKDHYKDDIFDKKV